MSFEFKFPRFDEEFPLLNQLILGLAGEHKAEKIQTWNDLDQRAKSFFTTEIMNAMDAKAPGWKKMASYSNGITLTHVTCVFLGMYMLPEYDALSDEQKQLAKWIILFHDIDKVHVKGKKDTMHPFKSAVVAAKDLPTLGFTITKEYPSVIEGWSNLTTNAYISRLWLPPKPNNKKIPEILSGINRLFGDNSPAALITKTILLHTSLDVDKNYPTPAAFNEAEIKRFIDPLMFPLLKVMMLSDNEGWSLFEPKVRQQQRHDTIRAFERFQELIHPTS